MALTFCCKLITPKVNLASIILMSVVRATVYLINLASSRVAIKVLLSWVSWTCRLVMAYLLVDTCAYVMFR